METAGKYVDRESEVFKRLKGKFRHFCQDWDMMAIDETCDEIEACTCNFGSLGKPPIKAIKSGG